MNRTDLQESYIQQLIEGMDLSTYLWPNTPKTMKRAVYDSLNEHLSKYSESELITEVEEYYPELLEEV